MKKLLLSTLLFLGLIGSVNASMIYSDTYDAGGQLLSANPRAATSSVSWTFDLTADGYDPLSEEITSASIGLSLTDDSNKWYDLWEDATLDLGVNSFSWEVDTGVSTFTVNSLLSLSNTGLLDVTLTADFGDFYFNSATLTATAESVPEPSIIALLGLGLVGMGFARRKVK